MSMNEIRYGFSNSWFPNLSNILLSLLLLKCAPHCLLQDLSNWRYNFQKFIFWFQNQSIKPCVAFKFLSLDQLASCRWYKENNVWLTASLSFDNGNNERVMENCRAKNWCSVLSGIQSHFSWHQINHAMWKVGSYFEGVWCPQLNSKHNHITIIKWSNDGLALPPDSRHG